MSFIREENPEEIKSLLKNYRKEDIRFNDQHFENQLFVREGNKDEVIKNLLNPENLVYTYSEKGKYGDTIHCLHFKISNTRTMKLPIIFDRKNRKCLYIITYIMRHRHWENMVRRKPR